MPYKNVKRIGSLQVLCEEIILEEYFDELKNHMGCLPFALLDELRRKTIDFPLPSEIFINSQTEKIDCNTFLDRTAQYDLPIGPFLSRIGNVCKNLTNLKLIDDAGSITNQHLEALVPNIPQIRNLSLKSAGVQDPVLLQIGSHCSQLQNLDLSHCAGVTNNGISLLCMDTGDPPTSRNLNIVCLNLSSTSVTGRGCVTAWRNLPLLMEFDHDEEQMRYALLTLRWEVHAAGWENASPITSVLSLANFTFNLNADLKLATVIFPNLNFLYFRRNVPAGLVEYLPKFRHLRKISITTKDSVNLNTLLPKLGPQLTDIVVANSIFDVRLIGALFPTLKYLCVSGVLTNAELDGDLIAERSRQHIPFGHLSWFVVASIPGMSNEHLLLVLQNAKKLERLQLAGQTFTDHLIMDVLSTNRMLHLKSLTFMKCNRITAHTIVMFLEMNNPLDNVLIENCPNVDRAARYPAILKTIQREKLNVKLIIQ